MIVRRLSSQEFNSSTREAEASLVYRASSRRVSTTWRNLVIEKTKNKEKETHSVTKVVFIPSQF